MGKGKGDADRALGDALARLEPKTTPGMGASERAKIGAAWRRTCARTASEALAKARASGVEDTLSEGEAREGRTRGIDARVLARAKQRARAEIYRRGRALGAGPFKASAFARAVREAVDAWGEAALEAHGGRWACERALERLLRARSATPVTLERVLGLAEIDAQTWKTFEDASEWVESQAMDRVPLATVRAGAQGCMRWVARERARALGIEAMPSTGQIVGWTRHWTWPQATPPLGIAALLDAEGALKTPSQWAAALRLEQSPGRMRARLAADGLEATRAFVARAGASEEAHLRAALERLAREWLIERWLGPAAAETQQLVRTAECAPRRLRPRTMETARAARRALAQAAAGLLAEVRTRWAREDALPGNGWGARARLTVRMSTHGGGAPRGRRAPQVGWLVAFDEPCAVLALCKLRGYDNTAAVHRRTGAWVGIGSARAVHAMEGLGEASLESYLRAGVSPQARALAFKRVFRE